MTRYPTPAHLKRHRDDMRKLRERRDRKKTCQRCDAPVVEFTEGKRAGELSKLCQVHLDADRERKQNARTTKRGAA
jgi:hypothetical protein